MSVRLLHGCCFLYVHGGWLLGRLLLLNLQGGILVMEWLIVYGTTWGLLIAVFCETMVISFCYGMMKMILLFRNRTFRNQTVQQ